MDIEKQAADLRCCGNCKHGGMKWHEEQEQLFYGCGLNHDVFRGDPCSADMVCPDWASDGRNNAWRMENYKEWCTPVGNFGLKVENPLDTLPEV